MGEKSTVQHVYEHVFMQGPGETDLLETKALLKLLISCTKVHESDNMITWCFSNCSRASSPTQPLPVTGLSPATVRSGWGLIICSSKVFLVSCACRSLSSLTSFDWLPPQLPNSCTDLWSPPFLITSPFFLFPFVCSFGHSFSHSFIQSCVHSFSVHHSFGLFVCPFLFVQCHHLFLLSCLFHLTFDSCVVCAAGPKYLLKTRL